MYDDDDNFSDNCESSHSSVQLSQSFSGSHFLPPYPGSYKSSKTGRPVYSHSETEMLFEKKPDYKTVDSRKGQYSKEHAIKLSGVRFNVGKKKDLSLLSCLVN